MMKVVKLTNMGVPNAGIHALQLEMVQKIYMDEESTEYLPEKAEKVRIILKAMFQKLIGELK